MEFAIYAIVGILVGALCTYLILRRYTQPKVNDVGDGLQPIVDDNTEELKKQLQQAERDFEHMKTLCDGLKLELGQAQKAVKEQALSMLSDADADTQQIIQKRYAEYEVVIADCNAKLKKALKEKDELEEEKDDLEDDMRHLKKQIDRQKEDLSELDALRDALQKQQANIGQMQKQLGELKLKEEALEFVKTILLARHTVGQDKRMLDQLTAIDKFASYVKEEYWPLMKDHGIQIDQNSQDQQKQDLFRWVSVKKKRWINNKKAIAFIGEFSAGKTSIVNKILKQNGSSDIELPVSSQATTAIPTYISGSSGQQLSVSFVSPDETQKTISPEAVGKINKELLDAVDGVSNLIKYFVITVNNQNLDQLSILDTPGFNSNDPEDTRRTVEVINECDALFWVVDANAGTLNKSSLQTIKKELRKPLYIIINKADTKSSSEIQQVQKGIEKELGKQKIPVESIFSFSQRREEDLKKLMNIISTVKSNSFDIGGYLDDLNAGLVQLSRGVQDKVKNVQDKKMEALDCMSEKKVWMKNICGDIEDYCQRIASIPKLKERWFGQDRYEFSTEDWDVFIGLLNSVLENVGNLISGSVKLAEGADSYRDSESRLSTLLSDKERIKGCISEFNKRIKELDRNECL